MNIFSPLWNTENGFTSFVKENSEIVKSKSTLIQENNILKDQIANSQRDDLLAGILRKENEDLKNILNRKPPYQKQILATVLVKPFLSPYDTLIIDIGIADGIVVGDKVIANGDMHIGYISDSYSNSSKVVLYSSPGEKTRVLIGSNHIEKEAIGLGGGNFSAEMPRETSIREGDPVVIPSISSNIFAVVEKINFKEADSFQTVLFQSPVNLNELKWVEVVPAMNK